MLKYLVLTLCLFGGSFCTQKGNHVTEHLATILSNYDRRVRPNYGEKPTVVETTAYLLQGGHFDGKEGLISVEGYFREMWNDPRLAFNDSSVHQITTNNELLDKIWHPDTFVANGEVSHEERDVFIKISSNGDVFKSVRNKIRMTCEMGFSNFPMDVQICSIERESYGYAAKDIIYKFKRGKSSVGATTSMAFGSDLTLFGTRTVESSIVLTSGNYSRLIIELVITRNPARFIKYFYVPAILAFLVCWGIFWLPASSVLLRGFLGFMCLKSCLGLMYKGGDYNAAGTMTKLDDYLITCAILSLIALTESIWVHYLYRNRPGVSNVSPNDPEEIDITEDNETPQPKITHNETGLKKIGLYLDRGAKYTLNIRHHRRGHEKVDMFCRIVFPLFFILFNIVYWVVSYRKMNATLELHDLPEL